MKYFLWFLLILNAACSPQLKTNEATLLYLTASIAPITTPIPTATPLLPTVSISSPTVVNVVNAATTLTPYTVSGSCSENGRTVTVFVTDGSTTVHPVAQPLCDTSANPNYTTTVNLTTLSNGTITFKADHVDAAGNSAIEARVALTKDLQAPTLASVTINGSVSLTNSTTYHLVYGAQAGGTYASYCILENSTVVGSCSWTSGTLPTTYTVTSTNNAKVLSVWIQDSVGNISTRVDSNSVTLDTTLPTVTFSAPTALSVVNSTTTLATYAITGSCSENGRTVTVAVTDGSITVNPTTQPTCNTGATPQFSTTVNLTTLADGTITFKADHTDVAGNSATQATVAVAKHLTLPPAPTVALSDPNTSSTVHTNHATNTITITSDTGATQWCVIEQASAAAAPSAPLYNDACFVSTRPTAITFSYTGRGLREAYVYTQDIYGNVSATAGSATLEFPIPTTFTFTGPATAPQSGCSDPYVLTAQDTYGLSSPSSTASPITLSGVGAGNFYSDAGCTTVTTTAMAIGDATKNIYFKSGTLATLTLQASGFSTAPTVSTTVTSVNAIATTLDFSCAIVSGSLQCWGLNDNGQLANAYANFSKPYPYSVQAPGYTSQITQISLGDKTGCLVLNGSAKCWGNANQGALGNGGTTEQASPVDVSGLTSGVRQVSTSQLVSCAVVGDGAQCWGDNRLGSLGNGTSVSSSTTPVSVTGLGAGSGVTAVAASINSCAIVKGALKCWGSNDHGQLGNNTTTDSNVPVDVSGMSSGVTAVAVYYRTACAIQSGVPYCWGYNGEGQVGDSTSSDHFVPSAVVGISSGATSIAVGRHHACAVVSGGLQCWGNNSKGQLGVTALGTYGHAATAVPGLTAGVATVDIGGGENTCATLTNGQFRCLGNNQTGQLANGVTASLSVPYFSTNLGTTVSVAGSQSEQDNCVILTNGKIQCWGENNNNRFGDGTTNATASPVYNTDVASGATSLFTGGSFLSAVVNGAVEFWGDYVANLNTGTVIASSATKVSSNTTDYSQFVCAIVNGGVQCWGDNSFGQLGNNSYTSSSTPVQVSGIGAGAGATDISVGYFSACAVVSGAVKCWGVNYEGQLGNGTSSTTPSQTPVTAIASGAVSVSIGRYSACAVLATGAVECWGADTYHALGVGDNTDHLTPTAVSGISSGAIAVSVSDAHACALMSDGTVRCWGANSDGKLGNGTFNDSDTPVTVATIVSGATNVSTSLHRTCAVVSGSLACWGADLYSGLGDAISIYGTTVYTPTLVGSPAVLTVSGPATSTHNVCSSAFTLTIQNSAGVTTNAAVSETVSLTNGGTGAFYSDPGCGTPITTVTIAAGSSSGTFYYQAPTAQQVAPILTAPNLARTALVHTSN